MALTVSRFARSLPSQPFGGWRSHTAELGFYLCLYLIYLLLRAIAVGGEQRALSNADRIVDLESALGLLHEPALQDWALNHAQPLAALLNWVYIVTYWPVILAAALALYLTRRCVYLRYRNLLVAHLALALVLFVAFPLAPPYKTELLADTIQLYGPAIYGGPAMAPFYNINAAMPSLHFSWTCILAWLCVREFRGWQRYLALGYPVLTLAAIVVTGNHYFLDAAVGAALIPVAYLVSRISQSAWVRRSKQNRGEPVGL